MQVITQVKIDIGDKEQILCKMKKFNLVCNYLSQIAFNERIWYWLKLQKRAYRELRDKFGLSSVETTIIIRKVACMYNNKSLRKNVVKFRLSGSIPLFRHIYRNNNVFFYGIEVPVIVREGVCLPKYPKQATLSYYRNKLVINQTVEIPEEEQYEPSGWLGCDMGIKNILTDSDGRIYSGGHLNNLRKRNNKT